MPRWASAAQRSLHALLLAGEQAVIVAGREMTREPVARWPGRAVPGPHPDRSYPQGATALDGKILFQQPDPRMQRTGLACTNLHRFRTMAIFYPNFYPKVQQSGAEMLYVLVIPANWNGRPGRVTSLPSWSCGFDSRRPLDLYWKSYDAFARPRRIYRVTTTLSVKPVLYMRQRECPVRLQPPTGKSATLSLSTRYGPKQWRAIGPRGA